MLLQAKDSDDDDEVTVSVDRDRFMDEFFEQVRGLFLQCSFEVVQTFLLAPGWVVHIPGFLQPLGMGLKVLPWLVLPS